VVRKRGGKETVHLKDESGSPNSLTGQKKKRCYGRGKDPLRVQGAGGTLERPGGERWGNLLVPVLHEFTRARGGDKYRDVGMEHQMVHARVVTTIKKEIVIPHASQCKMRGEK